jgi:hypothetical protein
MKKTFTFFALFVCVFFSVSVFAAQLEEKIDLNQVTLMGNCNYSDLEHSALLGIPDGKSHTFAGVSLLNIDKLKSKGTCVLGVRVFIGDAVESGKVFLGSDYLSPEVEKSFEYKIGGWQYVLFDQPYMITDKSLYIGFEATGTTSFLAVEELGRNVDGEMLKIDNNDWSTMADAVGSGYVWSMQAIVAGGDYSKEVQKDLILERATLSKAIKGGMPIVASFELRNAGVVSVDSVEVVFTIDEVVDTFVVKEKLMNGQSVVVEYDGPVAPEISKIYQDCKVKLIANLEGDVLGANNEVLTTCRVYTSEAGARNKLLVEQFTGQGCRYCPEGAERLKAAIAGMENPEKVIWVAHHSGFSKDDFTLSESDNIADYLGVNGAPNCVVDRMQVDYAPGETGLVWHPYYSSASLFEELLEIPSLATMELDANYNEETRELSVVVSGKSLVDKAYITVLVKQSGIIARQTNGGNNYSHNNAPRLFLTKSYGDELTFDESGNYSVTYTCKIPASVGKFACEGDMDVVVCLHGDITNSYSRMVYNSDQYSFEVKNITDVEYSYSKDMCVYPNPTTDVLYIAGLKEGDIIKVLTIDGIVVKEQKIESVDEYIGVSDLIEGTYFLQVNEKVVKFVKK